MTWVPSVVGAIATIGGTLLGRKKKKKLSRAQRAQQAALTGLANLRLDIQGRQLAEKERLGNIAIREQGFARGFAGAIGTGSSTLLSGIFKKFAQSIADSRALLGSQRKVVSTGARLGELERRAAFPSLRETLTEAGLGLAMVGAGELLKGI